MKTLNIDELHNPSKEGRQSGRTVRMLVEAIQNTDFLAEDATVHIYVHSVAYGIVLAQEAEWIAKELGFEKVVLFRNAPRIDVNGRMFIFHTSGTPQLEIASDGHMRSVSFADHLALGED